MLILKALDDGVPKKGFERDNLSNDLQGALQIRQGSLYPALYRLKRRGWLKADWKTIVGDRETKFYKLTHEGRRQLESETAGWKRLCEAISLVLETNE